MKAIWCIMCLAVIRIVMEMMVREAAPLWVGYDMMQKTIFVSLLAIFSLVAGCVVFLGISNIRKERAEGQKIRAY